MANDARRPLVSLRHDAVLAAVIVVASTASCAHAETPRDTVSPIALYLGEAAANVIGGKERSATYTGRFVVGADIDSARWTRIADGALRIKLTQRHGDDLNQRAIGNGTGVQQIWSPQGLHLGWLTYRQRLLEAGARGWACGSPTFVFKTSNLTYFPASSWGARIQGWLGTRVSLHAGVYEVNPDRTRADDDGTRWGITHATGVVVPFELGYQTPRTDRWPRTYLLGAWYDFAAYADPLLDDRGDLAIRSGRPPATRHGRSGAYVRLDQEVWHSEPDATTRRTLRVLAVAIMSTSGRVVEDGFAQLGVIHTGLLRHRDDDTLGFVINVQKFSALAIQNLRAGRASSGGTANVPSHQIMMELAYGAQLTPAVRLSPNLQYINHVDSLSDPFRAANVRDAMVVGLKLTIDAYARR